MSKCMLGGILGAISLFIWGSISWMVLPWHMDNIHTFQNETAISQAVQSNSPVSGMYFSPSSYKTSETKASPQVPMVFAAVHLEGIQGSLTNSLIISFLTQFAAALLVAWMLCKTNGLNYFQRVGFVMVFALAAGVVTEVPYWNWFKFDIHYTLMSMADLLIGWYFAGLLMAAVCKK